MYDHYHLHLSGFYLKAKLRPLLTNKNRFIIVQIAHVHKTFFKTKEIYFLHRERLVFRLLHLSLKDYV